MVELFNIMNLIYDPQLLLTPSKVLFAAVVIAIWCALILPNILARVRARWILSRYPLVNPTWNKAARAKFASSVSELVNEGVAKVGPIQSIKRIYSLT